MECACSRQKTTQSVLNCLSWRVQIAVYVSDFGVTSLPPRSDARVVRAHFAEIGEEFVAQVVDMERFWILPRRPHHVDVVVWHVD